MRRTLHLKKNSLKSNNITKPVIQNQRQSHVASLELYYLLLCVLLTFVTFINQGNTIYSNTEMCMFAFLENQIYTYILNL